MRYEMRALPHGGAVPGEEGLRPSNPISAKMKEEKDRPNGKKLPRKLSNSWGPPH